MAGYGGGGEGGLGALKPPGSSPSIGTRPSAAGPFGSSPVTSPLVAARFSQALPANRRELPAGAWVKVNVDRPSIVWVASSIITGPIYYNAGEIPTCFTITSGISVPTLGGPIASAAGAADPTQISVRHGICYLSGPGDWWLYNSGSTAVEILVLDAADPAVAARYLNESGSSQWLNGARVTVNAASTLLVSDRRARGATILVHTGFDGSDVATTSVVWVSMEAAAVVGNGLPLVAGAVLSLTDELNYRGRIRAISTTGTVRVAVQEIMT